MKKTQGYLLTGVLALSAMAGLLAIHPHEESHAVCADGHVNHDGITKWKAWSSPNSLPSMDYYYLTCDVTLSEARFVNPGSALYLCLNGHSVTMNGATIDDAFRVNNDGRLNIYECNHSATHKYSIDETGLARVDDSLTEDYATFTGGYITTLGNGNAIRLKKRSRLRLFDGTLIGCKNEYGAAIYAPYEEGYAKNIELRGGNIIGNVATEAYGGVMAGKDSELHLMGTKIYDNKTLSDKTAGVYAGSRTYLSGSPKIYGNTNASGKRMDFEATHDQSEVSLEGALGSGAEIYLGNNALKGNVIKNYYEHNVEDPSTYFKPDVGVLSWAADGNNAVMTQKYVVTYNSNGGSSLSPTSDGVTTLPNPLPTPTKEHYAFDGWYKDSGLKTAATAGETISDDMTLYAKWALEAAIANVIDKIDEIGEVTLDKDAEITAARTAYDALSEEQQALVSNYADLVAAEKDYADLCAAVPVEELISMIGEVYYHQTCKDKIDTARNAYDALTGDQKALVSNYDVLVAAEKDYADLCAAVPVEELIDAIGTVDLSATCKEKIDAARAAYDALTAEQKALVENYDVLLAAEKDYGDLVAANAVEGKIAAIGEVDDSDACKEKIDAARAAYDALTAEQKALVENYDVLIAAEKSYGDLVASNAVEGKIAAIGEVDDSDACKAKIDAARAAYDALAADQKALVENYDVLIAAEKAYGDLIAANAVEGKIAAIGEVSYSKECKGLIDEARAAYDALTGDQKALVSNYATLTDAETQYEAIKQEGVTNVKALIAAIGEVTLDKDPEITAARIAYDHLTEEQQALVDNYDVLLAAEGRYYNLLLANAVEEKIAAIGEVDDSSACKAKIDAARAAYDALNEAQKALVSNYAVFLAAEKDYADLCAAVPVEKLIAAIGQVDDSSACKEKIDTARTAYDALTADQKAWVDNEDVLLAAEKDYGDLIAANAVEGKIAAIGEVDDSDACKAKIDAARAAYDALTAEQKALVSNYDVLVAAEKDYADLCAAVPVEELIAAIGQVDDSSACKAKIDAARAAYDALTADQKALVENYDVLIAAEKAYGDLVAANAVEEKNAAIGKIELTEACKAKIDAARASYDALTADQKSLVNNVGLLTHAEATYQHVDQVANTIDAVGDVTLESGDSIKAAQAAYDALTEEEKAIIPNYREALAQKTQAYEEKVQARKTTITLSIVFGSVGGVILLLGLTWVLMLFAFNQWIKEGDKFIRVFKLGAKNGKVTVLAFPFKFLSKDASEIYKSKADVLK